MALTVGRRIRKAEVRAHQKERARKRAERLKAFSATRGPYDPVVAEKLLVAKSAIEESSDRRYILSRKLVFVDPARAGERFRDDWAQGNAAAAEALDVWYAFLSREFPDVLAPIPPGDQNRWPDGMKARWEALDRRKAATSALRGDPRVEKILAEVAGRWPEGFEMIAGERRMPSKAPMSAAQAAHVGWGYQERK